MSEFSLSYHVSVSDGRAVEKLLRHAKLSGVVFGPANGWLTFVPYAGSVPYRNADGARFADYLSRLTKLPVLHYCYAEDHGWTFALSRPDCAPVNFACWWDPSPIVERDQFDPLAFEPLVQRELLNSLLRSFDHGEAMHAQPAYRFAELLGLPAYEWLSPEFAQDHTSELLERGGRKLGTKPVAAAARLRLPPNRQIVLPRPHVSAREALEFMLPFMARFKQPWSLTMLSTYGFRLPDGRGIWQARWRCGDSGDMVEVVLLEDGRLIFRGETAPSYALNLLPNAMNLPDRWLDSTDIAAIVARLPVPSGFATSSLGSMTLRSLNDHPHLWEILFPGDRNGAEPFASWIVYLDALSGEVVAELLGRRIDYEIVPARRRLRDGDWEDLGPAN